MNKLFLTKNPDVFQGEKYLKTNKQYFEGWYFKNTNDTQGISFIPGININDDGKEAFIQVITKEGSYFVKYNIDDFEFSYSPFYIKIGNNFFSKEKIHIDINDSMQDIIIYGDIHYKDSTNIKTSLLNPNIMGPFSYIPFMECNHAILSMKGVANGFININDEKLVFNNGTSYIEKDFGCSFPSSYIWCQGNEFQNSDASFMLSIADIPLNLFNFEGVICVLKVDDSEYKFTTYNNTKIIKYEASENLVHVILKKNDYYLYIDGICLNSFKLVAPIKGRMSKDILESISSVITVTLIRGDETIFYDTSINAGIEIVRNDKVLSLKQPKRGS